MAEFPALPLFTDSLLADCSHLPDADLGLYMRILILMWRTPDCKIPNDPSWIARRLGKQALEYDRIIKPLIEEFCQTTGNFITQKRLIKEFKYLTAQRTRQKANVEARWNGQKSVDNSSVSDKPLKNKETTPSNGMPSGNTKTIPPTPPHPTRKKDNPLPLKTTAPSAGERAGGFKDLGGVLGGLSLPAISGSPRAFDIRNNLNDHDYQELYAILPLWDRKVLFDQYNDWIVKVGVPRNPRVAFMAWCKKKPKNP